MVISELMSYMDINNELTSLFFRWLLLKELCHHIIDEFLIGNYSYFEFDFIFFFLRTLMDLRISTIEKLAMKFAGNILKQSDYIKNKEKQNFSDTEKLIFDELNISLAAKLVYTGLSIMMFALKESDNLKFIDSRSN